VHGAGAAQAHAATELRAGVFQPACLTDPLTVS